MFTRTKYFATLALSVLLTTACTAQNIPETNRQVIGRTLGSYGAAKLCGGDAATQIACAVLGGNVGANLFTDQQPRYVPERQPYYYQPYPPVPGRDERPCRNVLVQVPNNNKSGPKNVIVHKTMCLMENGTWQLVSTDPD